MYSAGRGLSLAQSTPFIASISAVFFAKACRPGLKTALELTGATSYGSAAILVCTSGLSAALM
jgi:hypothetical protein